MSQLVIGAALDAHLKAWADSVKMQVAFQNVSFSPSADGGTYLRAYLLPAKTADPSVGVGHRRYTGIYQVTVCVARGVGRQPAEKIVSALEGLFRKGTILVKKGLSIWVDSTPSAAPPFQDENILAVPVSITYRCEAVEPE